MGRITDSERSALSYISDSDRVEVLYYYLIKGYTLAEAAEEVFSNYNDQSSRQTSLITRSFGFHQGQGRGRYSSLPKHVIWDFVEEYAPEDYNGGLDAGTFDRFIQQYRAQIAAQQQRERAEAQRRQQQEAEQRERQRQQQLEYERQQKIWAAEQERLRQQREAERRAREEAERQERLRREEAERQERLRREEAERQERIRREQAERARQAAFARGDHERLMEEAEAALNNGNYTLARTKAQQAWDIHPMVGLQYILAGCADGLGERAEAVKWAREALEHYSTPTDYYHLELCKILLNNASDAFQIIPLAMDLRACYMLDELRDSGLRHLAKCVCNALFELTGGLRIMDRHMENDEKYLSFAEEVARLATDRLPKNGQNRRLMLDCAYILTYQGAFREAFDIYRTYDASVNYQEIGDAYDLCVNMGWCAYQVGDKADAYACWFHSIAVDLNQFNEPLDAFVRYNYADALLALTHDHPNIQRGLAIAEQYLNGEIPGSRYYSRCYAPWQRAIGIELGEETRWYCDDRGHWSLDIYTPDPGEAIREKARGFLGKLFGR